MRVKVLSWLGTFLILVGTLFPGVHALAEQADVSGASGDWSLSSSGPEYADGKTTFRYTISSTGRPLAIDLMDLVLCSTLDSANVDASHGGTVGSDLSLGLPHVIQWEGARLRAPTTVRVTYDGLWATGEQSWYIQAGQDIYSGTVEGPTCETLEPGFEIAKSASDTDDPVTGSDSITLTGGGTAYYFYTVTNTGDLDLTIASATDDMLGPVTFPATVLAPGQSTSTTMSKQFAAPAPGSGTAWETNTVTVTVEFADRTSLTRSDQATVEIQAVAANPDFTVTKGVSETNDPDLASGSITLTGGGKAYYFYTVTNTGNVPLTIMEAADDVLGGLNFSPAVIPAGATATASAEKSFPALAKGAPDQTEVNTVVVTVSHPSSTAPLSRSAQATVVNKAKTGGGGGGGGGGTPTPTPRTSFTVAKAASRMDDASTGEPLVDLTGGGTVYYFYTVANTGETAFTIETAIDDKLGALTFSPATLAPGETATARAEKLFGAPPAGSGTQSETNVVSVSVRNERGTLFGPVTAQATVTNQAEPARPNFTVSKRASATNDPATGQNHLALPAEGGTVYYFYTVTNTGNVPLTVAEAVDDKLGPVSLTTSTIQPGGTATGLLTRQFGPKEAGQTETNRFSVTTTHQGVVYGPKTDSVSVQVAAQAEPKMGSLEVRVMDGSPRNNGIHPMIPGAVVTLSNSMHGVTDATGRIRFADLPLAEYEAAAASLDPLKPRESELRTGSATATLTPASPDQVITIILAWEYPGAPNNPPAPQISVAVCQTFTSMGGEVVATGPGGATAWGDLQSDGTYLLKGLTAGQWTVALVAPGLPAPVTRTLDLRSDNHPPNNAYGLDLSGVCPAAMGAAIGRICSPKQPGAEIKGTGPRGLTASIAIPSDGRLGQWREYRIDNLWEGDWKLSLHTPGQEPVSQTVPVKAGETIRVNDFSLACTGQSGPNLAGLWYYLSGGLMIAAGIALRRRARAF